MFAEKPFKPIYGMPKKSAAVIGEYAFRRESGNCRRQNKESAAAGASLPAPPMGSPENIFSSSGVSDISGSTTGGTLRLSGTAKALLHLSLRRRPFIIVFTDKKRRLFPAG